MSVLNRPDHWPARRLDQVRAHLEGLGQDLSLAFRTLRRSPAFALPVLVTLSVAIGGTTAVFGLIDGLFLRGPEGVRNDGSLRRLLIKRDAGAVRTLSGGPGTWLDYTALRDGAEGYSHVAAYIGPESLDLDVGARADRLLASIVSHEFLDLVTGRPSIGRLFVEADARPGAPLVAVISHAMWLRRFGGAETVVGTTLLLNRISVEIVGVASEGFAGTDNEAVDVWLPPTLTTALGFASAGPGDWRTALVAVRYVVRLAAGVEDAAAAAQAGAALRQAAQTDPTIDQTPEALTTPMTLASARGAAGTAGLSLWLGVAAGLVLFIACANVTSLMLARVMARRREFAVRLSIGGGRFRVARLILAESLVLALLGGAAGHLLARWAIGLLQWQLPVLVSVGESGRLLVFTLAISLTTAAMIGLSPAIRAGRMDPVHGLKESDIVGARRSRPTRRLLVTLQLAFTLALLSSTILVVRSLHRVMTIDPGVNVERVLVATVDLARGGYPASTREELYRDAIAALSVLPGVEAASVVHFVPFSGLGLPVGWKSEGQTVPAGMAAFLNLVGPDYFEVAGTRLLRGRTINAADRPATPQVAVVNDKMARLMAADGNVVGTCVPIQRQLKSGGCTHIVGVVETQRNRYLDAAEVPMVFAARDQAPHRIPYGEPAIVVRARGIPADVATSVRAAVQGLRTHLPYVKVEALSDTLESDVQPFRAAASLFSIFAAIALVLSAVGLYGVVGGYVLERTREIGVRRSLGAPGGRVLALVMRETLIPAGAGLALGVTLAYAGARYLASLLYGIEARDTGSLLVASVCFAAMTLTAILVPALRAIRVEPIMALRHE